VDVHALFSGFRCSHVLEAELQNKLNVLAEKEIQSSSFVQGSPADAACDGWYCRRTMNAMKKWSRAGIFMGSEINRRKEFRMRTLFECRHG
jgi:hypothetical protein